MEVHYGKVKSGALKLKGEKKHKKHKKNKKREHSGEREDDLKVCFCITSSKYSIHFVFCSCLLILINVCPS